ATLRTKVRRFSFGSMLVSEAILLATLACRQPWAIIALLAAGTIPPWRELNARNKPTRVFVIHMALFVGLLVAGQAIQSFGDDRPHRRSLRLALRRPIDGRLRPHASLGRGPHRPPFARSIPRPL